MTTPPTPPVSVTLNGVARTYRSRGGDIHALRGITHHFLRGTFTAVMGPSGSGKTTLLHVAAGLDRPSGGDVVIGGTALGPLSETQRTKLRRTSMAFVFQSYNLLDALSVFDNVALPARLAGRRIGRPAVHEALEQVGLEKHAQRRPPQLSGGQQQRVAIARALHTRPQVLFADEPTGALDRASGRQVLDLLRATTDQHDQTAVMVTHDPVAASYAHTTLFLEDGLVVGRLDRADAAAIATRMNELER